MSDSGAPTRNPWRKVFVLLAVIVALGVLDYGAAVYEGGKVRAKLAALRAQGIPTEWRDLIPKAVPEAENAAPLYMKAADILKQRAGTAKRAGGGSGASRYDTNGLDDPARYATLAKHVAEDMDALRLIREAAARPSCRFDLDWSTSPEAPSRDKAEKEDLDMMVALAQFVACAAVVASRQGDQAEALDRLRLGFVISRHISEEPTVSAQMESMLTDSIAAGAVARTIEPGPTARRRPLPRGGAEALRGELGRLDYLATVGRALDMQRCAQIYVFGQDAGKMQKDPAVQPVTYLHEVEYLDCASKASKALTSPAWQGGAILGQAAWYDRVAADALPVFREMVEETNEAVAERALVGAALGIELYKQKMGKYPATLDDVRKALNWKIADDPFSGKDLVYKRVGETYLLYSLGPDLKDEGGKPMWYQLKHLGLASGPMPKGEDYYKGDLVWMGTWKERKR